MREPLPIQLVGTGAYVPDDILTNEHFTAYLDTSDEWIVSRTGIRERRRVGSNECTSTMASIAARRALKNAGLSADEIDVIVCATATGDQPFPATATFVQHAIGASNVPAFDVGAACAGFIYAASVAAGLIMAGSARRTLVIGADTLTRIADPRDRATAVLLGDGAGATIMERAKTPGPSILYCELGCDGSRTNHICIPAGGSKLPASNTTVAERLHYMKMQGREVYKFAVVKLQELIDNALSATGLHADDLRLVIPHQSNLRIIESVRARMGLPREKFSVNIDRYGNTSAASVIMALDAARRDGTLNSGDLVLMVALGAGLVWGAILIRL